VSRLFDRRTGAYAAVALTTMPLYFVQARSMIGDVCTMAGLAMAFGGLAVAAFGAAGGLAARAPWLAMAAVGLAAGFESRGGLLGLGVPLLGVGLAWAVVRASSRRLASGLTGDVIGAASLLAGAVVATIAVRAVAGESKDLDRWIGTLSKLPPKYPTYEYYVASIGHSLAPWSALLPFAFGRMLLAPPAGDDAAEVERESVGRVAILVGAAVAFVAHAYLVARTDLVAFTAPALCAVACAVTIRDFERGAPASVAVGLGTLVLAAVLHHDFHEMPEKAYQAFGITGAPFPEGFKDHALALWWVALGGFAVCALLTWIERDPQRKPFDPAGYTRILTALQEVCDGTVAVVFFAIVAGASLAALAMLVGLRTHGAWLPQMSTTARDAVLNAWWLLALLPFVGLFGVLFACDIWLWAFGQSRPLSRASFVRGFEPFEELFARLRTPEGQTPLERREWWVELLVVGLLMIFGVPAITFGGLYLAGLKLAVAAAYAIPAGVLFFLVMGLLGDLLGHRAPVLALGGAAGGFVLCFSYYPALANQLSPKEVFESYRQVCPGAQLGLLGVGGRTSAYYAGGQPQTLTDSQGAYQWLTGGGGERRCLALKAEELPKMNQIWREHAPEPKTNLPVLDARSSQILLATSSLGAGDKNENPLASLILSAPPNPQRTLDVNMDDKLEVIGIDLDDERGRPVEAVSPGRSYHLKTYYRVLAPIGTEWEGFIHIDGYHRRHNGDHKPMNGKYPMSLWLPGDLLADDHEFKLEPNFTPGSYTVYFGLFVGDTRMKVKSGPSDGENRINGGALKVQ
jgi:hypothetical protein